MAGQFFKVAVRNLQRNSSISAVNISGLAVGIAGAVLILLWVQNQLSYDQFHTNKARIYQVFNRTKINGTLQAWPSTPMPLAPALKADYGQVEESVRTNWVGSFVLKNGDKKLETQGLTADPAFLKLFSFPLLKGNANTALNNVHSILLTQKLAKKLFGDTDPVGKFIAVDSTANFTVTGVLKNLPNNTQFSFEYIVPFDYMKEVHWYNTDWQFNSLQTYVMLKKGVTEATANKLFKDIYRRYPGEKLNDAFVHPMGKWWLYSNYENGRFVGGRLNTVHLFTVIALLIIFIACINYMNLGTARSARRAKEVGIRKVAGAERLWLIKQFLGESLLVAFVAGALGLVLVQLALPWFNGVVDRTLLVPYDKPFFWLVAVGFIILTGVVAGSYPAFYLSAFKPVKVLKGTVQAMHGLINPRRVLVVVQFTLAIVFIISTTVIYRQINYAQKRDTGYKVDNLVYIYIKGDIAKNYTTIRNDLVNSGAVSSITRTSSPIQDIWGDNDQYQWDGKSPGLRQSFGENSTDHDFTKTFGLKLLAGRDIDIAANPTDTSAVLLTEQAAKIMNFKNPVGQTIKAWNGNYHVVGIVKNYVAISPFAPSLPIIIRGADRKLGTITLKLNTQNSVADNINKISTVFKQYNPNYPFDFKFLDESYRIKFQEEQHIGQMVAVFAGLTIFISCLGLFALAACMAEGRTKEIGIRKVLGASVVRITALLTGDFLILVLIAFAIACPVAWWLMNKWLQGYPYHTNINWWIFGLTGLASVLIAFSTVSSQAIKAALANPAKSLKTE
ncbi:ABC transporter permease [Mucilaginibacter rigui]|uniref:ABC transporter permease n=2 Tax=Mucilaginibacter rigui TaxID=534635 RepID=A0ABR7X237_9SPHI|nr:ABC transporter permease [Mucilaginibacter rigui]